MAIAVRGSPIVATAIDGGSATLDLTTITGLAQNDVVYVVCGVPRITTGAGTSSSGWTSVSGPLDNTLARAQVFRKVMGSTPDTSFVATGSGNAADGTIAIAIALSGVDTTTPEDATPTSKADTASTNPDAVSITTVTANAWVLDFAVSGSSDSAITTPSGYSNALTGTISDTRPVSAGVATILKATAGAEDPPAWTSWNTGRWIAFTVAVRPASAGAYTIAAAAGSYAVTGTAATLKMGRKVAASAGSYAISGTAATLRRALPLMAGAGSYALSGTAAALKVGRKIAAAAGSYAITGTAAGLIHGYKIAAVAGSYSISGAAVTLKAGRLIVAANGSYSIGGTAATLTYAPIGGSTYTIVASPGSYAVSGTAATLKLTRLVAAAGGSYVISGADAGLVLDTGQQPPVVTGHDPDAGRGGNRRRPFVYRETPKEPEKPKAKKVRRRVTIARVEQALDDVVPEGLPAAPVKAILPNTILVPETLPEAGIVDAIQQMIEAKIDDDEDEIIMLLMAA